MQKKHQKNAYPTKKNSKDPRVCQGCFWSPVENREEPIKSVLCVCPSVRVSVTDYLRNRSEDFSETWHEVGGKKCKKRSTAAFFEIYARFLENRSFVRKKHFWPFSPVFGTLRKIRSEDFP